MMERVSALWNARSTREQWLLAIMFALLAAVIFWFGLLLPIDRAQRSTRATLREATDRHAAIEAKVKLLRSLPRSGGAAASATPLDQFVGQSAGEAGLTLERAQARGAGRIDIAIASVRPVALFTWLSSLEAQGVRVDTLTARPSPIAGSIAVQAVLLRGGGQ